MTRRPTVSIVMPARDAARTIDLAIASVQAQTLADWELLIVDNASTDSTAQHIARAASADSRIEPIPSSRFLTAAGARNLALDRARGDLIGFLDADDRLDPSALAMLVAAAQDSGLGAAAGGFRITDLSGVALHQHTNPQPIIEPNDLIDRAYLVTGSHLFHRDHLADERFDPSLDAYEDLELWLRLAARGLRWAGVEEIVHEYTVRPLAMPGRSLQRGRACCAVLGAHFEACRNGATIHALSDDSPDREQRVRRARMLTYATREIVMTSGRTADQALECLRAETHGIPAGPDEAARAAWYAIIFALADSPPAALAGDPSLDQTLRRWWRMLEAHGAGERDLATRAQDALHRSADLRPQALAT